MQASTNEVVAASVVYLTQVSGFLVVVVFLMSVCLNVRVHVAQIVSTTWKTNNLNMHKSMLPKTLLIFENTKLVRVYVYVLESSYLVST